MTVRTYRALSHGLLCLIALWVLNLCWVGALHWDVHSENRPPLAQGHPSARHGASAKASPAFGAASAPWRHTVLKTGGA